MFINDVGENTWEEIDDGIAGSNYGWPLFEGPSTAPGYRSPLFAYSHNGQSAAISGGAFYDPSTTQYPASYTGVYFFADYLNDWIHIYNPATNAETDFATNLPAGAVDLKVGSDGSLYYLAGPGTGNGEVVRINYTTPPTGDPPTIVQQPVSQTVGPGQSAIIQRRGFRDRKPDLPVAARRPEHHRRGPADLCPAQRQGIGQRSPV